MTRKHFKAIGEIIKKEKEIGNTRPCGEIDYQRLVNSLANYFEKENPKFNRDKFIETCII